MSNEHTEKTVKAINFLYDNNKIIAFALIIGTSLLVVFLDGWETILKMMGASLISAILIGLGTQSIKNLFWGWVVVYALSLGGFFLARYGLLPSEF